MKRTGLLIAGTLLLMWGVGVWAQQKSKGASTKVVGSAVKKPVFRPAVYLGNAEYSGGPIAVKLFDSLLRKGLIARDSSGKTYDVLSFYFNYSERILYEDSTGDMSIMLDFSSLRIHGNKLSPEIETNLFERMKGGDTVFIEQVLLSKKNPSKSTIDTFLGKGFKCILTK